MSTNNIDSPDSPDRSDSPDESGGMSTGAKWGTAVAIVALLVIGYLVAFGGDDEPEPEATASELVSESPTPSESASPTESASAAASETTSATEDATAAPTDGATAAPPSECAVDTLNLFTAGTLTVATGEPVFEPWMVDDEPSNGEGFEGALVVALAAEMGFGPDDVTFVRTGFAEAVSPGFKDWDFNIQQYSINEARDEVVDFSDGYYQVEQAVVAAEDSPAAGATTVTELREVRLGAGIGTTSLDYAEEVIAPTTDVLVFNDNVAAKAAIDAGQVDALVFDVPTAYFVTAVEIPDTSIVGVLPVADEADELGLLFEDGNPLVDCVNVALAALVEDGTVAALQEEWLNQGGDIPTLTP